MRRALPTLVGIVLVAGGLFLLLTIFSNRDSAGIEGSGGPAKATETDPGDPPSFGPRGAPNLVLEVNVDDPVLVEALAKGNVALVYDRQPPGLLKFREELVGGNFDPELAAAGQMVFRVRRDDVDGIVALAWKRRLQVQSADDPVLREFVETWLGVGD